MLFSGTVFIYLFLPLCLGVYYLVLRKSRTAQNVFLFAMSLVFYAWGEPKFVLVMLLSVAANWLIGILIHRHRDRRSLCRLWLVLDCIFNISLLFVFKYLNFATGIIGGFFAGFPVTAIALPIGISFFTFQAMSYVIDVYRGRGQAQKSILGVGLYISFFPQLIAGPIVRYETIAEEINNRRETLEDFAGGFARFVMGLGKKVLLANSFAILADHSFELCAGTGITAGMAWLGAISYTLQIFFDFSGYSDMAIGLGRMFGFHFPENFDYPYISRSVTEFWRRWHISLGTWFRDYVYIPLGGSRVNTKARLVFNLFVVWLLTGIWHGANWTFVVWGLMYFVLLCVEKLTGFFQDRGKVTALAGRLYTLFFVIIGWVIFRSESLPLAAKYIASMFTPGTGDVFWAYFVQNLGLLIPGIALCTPVSAFVSKMPGDRPWVSVVRVALLVVVFVLSLASLISSSYNPFIYFNF